MMGPIGPDASILFRLKPFVDGLIMAESVPEPHQCLAFVFAMAGQMYADGGAGFTRLFGNKRASGELVPDSRVGQPANAQSCLLGQNLLVNVADGEGSLAPEYSRMAGWQRARRIRRYRCRILCNIRFGQGGGHTGERVFCAYGKHKRYFPQ